MASLVLFIAYSIALTLFADNKMLTSSRLWKCHKYKTPRQQHISSYQKHHVLRPLTGRIYHFTLPKITLNHIMEFLFVSSVQLDLNQSKQLHSVLKIVQFPFQNMLIFDSMLYMLDQIQFDYP